MKRQTLNKIFAALTLCTASTLACAAEPVTLTSLDWPPYTGEDLPDQGASVAVAKAAFAAAGYTLKVEFYPWQRAVALAKDSSKHDGYFPEYYADELKQDFILSEPMGSGPLGFAELKAKPVTWHTLDDLKSTKIGVVRGYVNTSEFDARMHSGKLKTDATGDDLKNLQKLLGGRISLAVIDKNVLTHLMSTTPELKGASDKIQFNATLLEDKSLYVCFKKGARGQKLAQALNEGMLDILPSLKQGDSYWFTPLLA
ncbi:MAG: ABC transporter substrate-binding protein [Hahellaceae bacterium]|nr:ABC transporter substrate-binding protein [Hahellaceae bacterium]MCP5168787.1 ABC transporter substrate-binding protein [Hahellaceae bacterium]